MLKIWTISIYISNNKLVSQSFRKGGRPGYPANFMLGIRQNWKLVSVRITDGRIIDLISNETKNMGIISSRISGAIMVLPDIQPIACLDIQTSNRAGYQVHLCGSGSATLAYWNVSWALSLLDGDKQCDAWMLSLSIPFYLSFCLLPVIFLSLSFFPFFS